MVTVAPMKVVKIESTKPKTTTTDDMPKLENEETFRELRKLLEQYGIRNEEFCAFMIKFLFDGNYLSYRCLPNRMYPIHVGQLYHLIGK